MNISRVRRVCSSAALPLVAAAVASLAVAGPAQAAVRGSSLSGDARAELVQSSSSGQLRAWPNVDGINFRWGASRIVGLGWSDPARTYFADLDGDGRDEAIRLYENGQLRAFPNVDGLNFGWGASRVIGVGWTDPQRVKFADLNGDGRDELINSGVNGQLRAWPNVDGINFSWGASRVVGVGWNDPVQVKFGDLNGDGRDELINSGANGQLRAWPNVDGLNFSWGASRVVGLGWTNPARTYFADLNGDGRDEAVRLYENGQLRAFPNVDGLNFNWGVSRPIGVGWFDPAQVKFA
jgi:hypothetical protein